MDEAWPWLAIAALGALHGLDPASGWPGAAACGWRCNGHARTLRALAPLAIGHLLSVLLVVAAVVTGLALPRVQLQWLAGGLLLLVWALHCVGRRIGSAPAGGRAHLALGLWSFVVSTAHGAGLMLVPALAPLCLSDVPAREIGASGSLWLALAAVGLHMAAMLGVAGAMAVAALRLSRWCRAALAGRSAAVPDAGAVPPVA
jgi:hypothetical protein